MSVTSSGSSSNSSPSSSKESITNPGILLCINHWCNDTLKLTKILFIYSLAKRKVNLTDAAGVNSVPLALAPATGQKSGITLSVVQHCIFKSGSKISPTGSKQLKPEIALEFLCLEDKKFKQILPIIKWQFFLSLEDQNLKNYMRYDKKMIAVPFQTSQSRLEHYKSVPIKDL